MTKTITQKQLKNYEQIQSISLHIGNDWNVDTSKHEYQLTGKKVLAVSTGRYGVNGALIESINRLTGKIIRLAVIGRTSELFELL